MSNLNLQSDVVYFHSDRWKVTYRIFALLDRQKEQLVNFLLGADIASPLPILGDLENRTRVDPEEPIRETGIYRDIWERKERPLSTGWGDLRLRDVCVLHDWVTVEEWEESRSRAFARRNLALYGPQIWDSAEYKETELRYDTTSGDSAVENEED